MNTFIDLSECVYHLTYFICITSDPGSIGLMVDKLIAQLGNQGVSQWILKGGNEIYPPSSLHVSLELAFYPAERIIIIKFFFRKPPLIAHLSDPYILLLHCHHCRKQIIKQT